MRVRPQLAADIDALSPSAIDVPKKAAGGWRRDDVEDLVVDLGPVADELEGGDRRRRETQAELPGVGGDGVEGRIRAELEGERTRIFRVRAGEFEDDRCTETVPVTTVDADLVGQEVIGPEAGGDLSEGVGAVVRRVEQIAERDADLIVTKRGEERERRPRRPPRLTEGADGVLFRGYVRGEPTVRSRLIRFGENESLHVVADVFEPGQQH